MGDKQRCISCGKPLIRQHGVWLCIQCNSREIDTTGIFADDIESSEFVFIECPGATIYEPETNNVIAGVRFFDNDDPLKGYKIIGEQVFAPNHSRRRRIKREVLGKIRRCQACQDYTVRMRRREGADFFIPSPKHPGRTKLKSIRHVSYEP